jgi:hypothetical protein
MAEPVEVLSLMLVSVEALDMSELVEVLSIMVSVEALDIMAAPVEAPSLMVVLVEALTEVVSVETPNIEPKARLGLSRETKGGSL